MTQQVTFTASVGGASTGVLTAPLSAGRYCFTFADAESRVVTVANDGLTCTWIGALSAGTITTATLAFNDQQKVDIRRHCWYPVFGSVPNNFQSYRFFQTYGLLEYRIGVQPTTGLANMLPEEQLVVINTYLANLATLENAIPAASANLDTDKAAVWTHNKNEVSDRDALFTNWRKKLCTFLGVPPGPDYGNAGGSNSLQLVV